MPWISEMGGQANIMQGLYTLYQVEIQIYNNHLKVRVMKIDTFNSKERKSEYRKYLRDSMLELIYEFIDKRVKGVANEMKYYEELFDRYVNLEDKCLQISEMLEVIVQERRLLEEVRTLMNKTYQEDLPI